MAEERDVNDTMETEMENGAAKRDEQEKIKSLLADTDKLIGNEEAHDDVTSNSEVKPLLTGADNSEEEELASFCAPKHCGDLHPAPGEVYLHSSCHCFMFCFLQNSCTESIKLEIILRAYDGISTVLGPILNFLEMVTIQPMLMK